MREPTLREIDTKAFRRMLTPLIEVYIAAMDPPRSQLPGRESIMQRHADHPGFRAFIMERRRPFGTTVAGFIYGFHGVTGQWWHDVVASELRSRSGPENTEHWMGNAYEVAELHVRPEYQGMGLGRKLLDTLCAGRPETTVVLSTLDRRPETPAHRLYRSVGFVDLLSSFEFPGGGPPYAVMGAPLPLVRVPLAESTEPR